MHARRSLAIALVAAGSVALATAMVILTTGPRRPAATGQPGQLEAFAQTASGPTRLWPGRTQTLPRPQDIAFRLTVDGTGPRIVRIEVETTEARYTAYEAIHHAPTRDEPLDFVLELGEGTPDRVEMVVTLEAPHTSSVLSTFPLQLVGASRRFWEP